MTLRTALAQGAQLLEDAAVTVPRLTAEVLLAHALNCERVYLYAHPEQELREVEWLHYGRYLHERLQGKPTQYITKRQEFYGREFRVTPDVLIPRPETEHVVEVALAVARGARRMVDVGTGSGALAVTLQLETGASAFATDISAAAASVAAANATRLGAPVEFVVCDVLSGIAEQSMDLIVSNPPYVPDGEISGLQPEVSRYEPRSALAGGPDGLDFYRMLARQSRRHLRERGRVAVEVGAGQAAEVEAIFRAEGFSEATMRRDLAGIPRVVCVS